MFIHENFSVQDLDTLNDVHVCPIGCIPIPRVQRLHVAQSNLLHVHERFEAPQRR